MYKKRGDTPLYDTLKNRAQSGTFRFHMPGHKGKDVFSSPLAGAQYIDFTELYGTGNLYDGIPPISDAERIAAEAFGTNAAFYLTGGATHGILTSLFLASRRTKRVLIDRGCHKSVYNAISLFGLEPVYIRSDLILPFGVSGAADCSELSRILSQDSDIGAVVITSPTYYGVVSDIAEIARICHKKEALLIVDEAHGAHFPFHEDMASSVSLGADLAVCSLHKTLPALGQAALLTSGSAISPDEIRRASAIFGTSSPSYNIMASMDLAIAFMKDKGREIEAAHAAFLSSLRREINARGVFSALDISPSDPMRLTVCTAVGGLCGYDAARILEDEMGIVCEMADTRNILFIITAADEDADLCALKASLISLERYAASHELEYALPPGFAKAVMTPHDAMFSAHRIKKLCDCEGDVSAAVICPYPPGIPILCGGEVIEHEHISFLYENGFSPEDDISVLI